MPYDDDGNYYEDSGSDDDYEEPYEAPDEWFEELEE